jgi:hypothetical protein
VLALVAAPRSKPIACSALAGPLTLKYLTPYSPGSCERNGAHILWLLAVVRQLRSAEPRICCARGDRVSTNSFYFF